MNSAIAVCVAAAVTATVVLINPEPVEAQETELINPELARAIFIRTVDEGWDRTYTHLAGDAERAFGRLIERESAAVNEPLADLVVGVPPDQVEYPAWFLASAVIPHEDGAVSIVSRFERGSGFQSWRMTELAWSADRLLPGPLLDGEWLAPMPETDDLLADPEDLPGMYADWLARSFDKGWVVPDGALTLRGENAPLMDLVTSNELPNFEDSDPPSYLTVDWEFAADRVTTDERIPMADGTVYVQFRVRATYTVRYTSAVRNLVCDPFHLRWGEDPPRYRSLTADLPVTVDAWLPIPDLVPEPAEDAESELAPEPVDPDEVVLEEVPFFDGDFTNHGGDRC